MATGIIGAITTGSLSFTTTRDTKVQITGKAAVSSSGSVSVNGTPAGAAVNPGGQISFAFYVAAGQTVTITATSVDGVMVSTLEE